MNFSMGSVDQEISSEGKFQRQEDAFREWVKPTEAVSGKYHLYVSLACPWASRTVIVRQLKGLQSAVGLTVCDPVRDERGWAFRDGDGYTKDPVNHFQFLSEAYQASDPEFSGRVTVPVLWDIHHRRIVNNSEDDICRILNDQFTEISESAINLFPEDIQAEHEALNQFLYEKVNNGVYRAGFATSQKVYERACVELFDALDQLDARLKNQRYLFGARTVEADWRLFCTLIRFDAVYHGHFKCNLRRITDYLHLQGYLLDLYQQPGIAQTVNLDHIKRHYYMTHGDINPNRIVPIGPFLNLDGPHERELLLSVPSIGPE